MFLTARLFMYQHVYFHRTVRAIDLDLAEVFAPSIRAVFGDGSPAERLAAYADLDEYALLHQAALWARGEHLLRRRRCRATGASTAGAGRRLAGDPAPPAALARRARGARGVRDGRLAAGAAREAGRGGAGRVVARPDRRGCPAGRRQAARRWRSNGGTAAPARPWRSAARGCRPGRSSARRYRRVD